MKKIVVDGTGVMFYEGDKRIGSFSFVPYSEGYEVHDDDDYNAPPCLRGFDFGELVGTLVNDWLFRG